MQTTPTDRGSSAVEALEAGDSSTRLRAALAIGTRPVIADLEAVVRRAAIEPDFYVRDMLTWALTRFPTDAVLVRLHSQLPSPVPQARSQALHTLSKIGAPQTWEWITEDLLDDTHDEVARSAWRAAVVVVPEDQKIGLGHALIRRLGRGDRAMKRSLSQALSALGEVATPLLVAAAESSDPHVSAHARATMALMEDPALGFDAAVHEARRTVALGSDFRPPEDTPQAGDRGIASTEDLDSDAHR